MICNISQVDRTALNALMAEADSFAKRAMQRNGYVPTTLFIQGPEGTFKYSPKELLAESGKQSFVKIARLMCMARKADATLIVSEAWCKRANPEEQHDPAKSSSECEDKREVLVMLGETRDTCLHRVIPMIRADGGRFLGFGEDQKINGQRHEGRFTSFILSSYPEIETTQLANEVLEKMGLERINNPVKCMHKEMSF